MAILSPSPKLQFFDANGNPLVGGKLYSYTAGTTSPLATYTDSTNTSSNTNPIILDSRGEAGVWLGASAYKLALYSATDVLIWSVDNVTAASSDTVANLAASTGASLIGYIQGGAGAVASTVQTKLRESVSVKDFGAVGDGVTDDYPAFAAALSASKRVYVPNPSVNYAISRPLVLNDDQQLIGESRESCIIEKTSALGPLPALGTVTVTRGGLPYVYDYDQNAVVIIKKPAGRQYPNGVGIHNITLQGKSGVTVAYGVYAPRLSRSRFTDVYISAVTNGWFTYDTFTCVFERVDIWNVSYGFRWANDGSSLGTGTSCTFVGCGVNIADVYGWYFYGLVYSSILGSFSESIESATPGNRPVAWFFELCKGLTVSGCGSEVVKGYTFRVSNGSVDIRGGTFTGLSGDTFGSATGVVFLDSGAEVSIGGGARFEAVTSPGNIYNEYVTGAGSLLTYEETVIRPTGGTAAFTGSGGRIADPSAPTTFTPTVIGSTTAGTATYSVQEGYYTRIGNVVYYTATLTWTGGTGTGNLYISGLPFMSRNTTAFAQGNVQPGSSLTVAASKVAACQVIPNTANIRLIELPVATGTVTLIAYQAATTVSVTGFYFV